MTIIKLDTPIVKPETARKDVNENIPPLLDLKYLKANLRGSLYTENYFNKLFKRFSMLFVYGGLIPSNNLSNLNPTSL